MIIYLNGKFVEKKDATLTPFNSALLSGMGVFETFCVINGKVFRFDDHIERFKNSIAFFGFRSIDFGEIKDILLELLWRNNLNSARIRITLTRNILSSESVLLIDIDRYKRTISDFANLMYYPEKLSHGCKLRLHKTTNYLLNEIALREALNKRYDEAIFIDENNHLLEGTRTNIFFVIEDKIITPSLDCGVLPGVTRKIVLEIAQNLGIECNERNVFLDEVKNFTEMFITNSINGIVKVSELNENTFYNFVITEKICNIYENLVKEI